MKNLIKVFTLVATFLFAFGETVDAQRIKTVTQTPASVVQLYKNIKLGGDCVGMSFSTNNVSTKDLLVSPPTSTWGSSLMRVNGNGLKSGIAKRFWSSRYNGNQPFAVNKTDNVELILTKVGNNVVAKLIKNGSTTFNINILGVMAKGKGHILYGTYGTHGGFISISLYKAFCPVG